MDRMGQHVPGTQEPLGNSDDGRLLVHCWEIENKARKQVVSCAKCWQESQSKQNWNIIYRIPSGVTLWICKESIWGKMTFKQSSKV